jgi:hypothetical protein
MGSASINPTRELHLQKQTFLFPGRRIPNTAGPDMERTFVEERGEYDDSGRAKFKMEPALATKLRSFVNTRWYA